MSFEINGAPWVVKRLPKILMLMIAAAALVGVVALILYIAKFGMVLSSSAETWGQFGDYMGGILNPIYGFLALLALLLTLYVQLFELRQSTIELRSSAAALAKQNAAMAVQNFESAFFQMVRLHNDIVAAIDLHSKGRRSGAPRVTRGRDCFKTFYRRFSRESEAALRGDFYPANYAEDIAECYMRFHEKNQQNVGHYFRNLYRAFKFIADSEVEDKARYSGILRAQLSTYELCLLFYNGISHVGGKFPKLAEQFQLFENLPTEHLVSWKEDRKLYSSAAFGEQAKLLDFG
jgi:uncharacterized membrane protein